MCPKRFRVDRDREGAMTQSVCVRVIFQITRKREWFSVIHTHPGAWVVWLLAQAVIQTTLYLWLCSVHLMSKHTLGQCCILTGSSPQGLGIMKHTQVPGTPLSPVSTLTGVAASTTSAARANGLQHLPSLCPGTAGYRPGAVSLPIVQDTSPPAPKDRASQGTGC